MPNTVKRGQEHRCTQTELQSKSKLKAFVEELKAEEGNLEENNLKERSKLEKDLKAKYEQVIETKNYLIKKLSKENEDLLTELRDPATRTRLREGITEEWDLGISTQLPSAKLKDDNNFETILRIQKGHFLKTLEDERIRYKNNLQIDREKIREEITQELKIKHANERESLLQKIELLKEGLNDMKAQKVELEKIFQGEKNALKIEYSQKEKQLKAKMKLEFERRIIQAQSREWSTSRV
ncbi:predicted protein [Nematostella vectensis]|uniref:Uncharacterized protein n=1 Tax=Nematostella vectensis TaxID=45351 RepID=A7RYP0_NEMVE|nr:coiled-coil domain-containing protein 30 [Nematostella vectensis]EDO43398.1 predicted protein [Nematostella vectensis]|eukprot:XP_001635461.1 predicted protein [Nematostella vectensis]